MNFTILPFYFGELRQNIMEDVRDRRVGSSGQDDDSKEEIEEP